MATVRDAVADNAQGHERNSLQTAYLRESGRLHVAGQRVGKNTQYLHVLFPLLYKAVAGAYQSIVNRPFRIEASSYPQKIGIGIETGRQALDLARFIPFAAPYVVVCALDADNGIAHLFAC